MLGLDSEKEKKRGDLIDERAPSSRPVSENVQKPNLEFPDNFREISEKEGEKKESLDSLMASCMPKGSVAVPTEASPGF